MQALEHQKNEDWDKFAATLQTLTKIQPNFVKVWEYQGHNLAFNVSMEFDDYEYRYEWVKKGLEFLKGGIPYNKNDHRMTDNMGFFTGTKFGKSDEKLPFRRIFRKDNLFHTAMSDYIEPESYDTREYGPDSYKMAWHWYDISQDLVEVRSNDRYKSDLMMGMYRPSQTRHQAMTLADEFRTGEVIQEIWARADEEWIDYGDTEMSNAANVTFTLEKVDTYERQLNALRTQLDELTPGARSREMKAKWNSLGLDESGFSTVEASPEELTDEQRKLRTQFLKLLNSPDQDFDAAVASAAAPENQLEARRVVNEIASVLQTMAAITKEGGTVNYSFWKVRNEAESGDAMVRARQAMYDAKEMKRKSIYEDEFVVDYETGEKKVLRQGADSLYTEAFLRWAEVLEQYPEIADSPMGSTLADDMLEYYKLLIFAGKEWPDDFPLQDLVDAKEASGSGKGLPTSDMIQERREAREDSASDSDDEDPDDSEAEENDDKDDESEDEPVSEKDDSTEELDSDDEADSEAKTDSVSDDS